MALLVGVVKCIRKNVLDVSVRLITAQNVKYTRLVSLATYENSQILALTQIYVTGVFRYQNIFVYLSCSMTLATSYCLRKLYTFRVKNLRKRTLKYVRFVLSNPAF